MYCTRDYELNERREMIFTCRRAGDKSNVQLMGVGNSETGLNFYISVQVRGKSKIIYWVLGGRIKEFNGLDKQEIVC